MMSGLGIMSSLNEKSCVYEGKSATAIHVRVVFAFSCLGLTSLRI